MSTEKRLVDLGLALPPPSQPIASYITLSRTGNLAYVSGHGPQRADGSWVAGRVGEDLDIEEACEAARLTALGVLSILQEKLGSLDEVVRVVKVLGMVNCTPDFTDQMIVVNAFSDLLEEVLGEMGRHARSVIGVGSLPMNLPLEVEVIVEAR